MPLQLDPKLVSFFVVALLTRLATYLGLLTTDPLVEQGISLLAGAAAAFFTPNDGTILRTEQESGNAYPPETP